VNSDFNQDRKTMSKYNASNERIKRQFFSYLQEAKRYSAASVDAAAMAIARFEAYTKFRDFKSFNREQAIAFKKQLGLQTSQSTGKALSKATLYGTLTHLKRFFHWLAGQPGYRSKLQYSDAEYFNLSEKDSRVATARRSRPAPTMEQVRHVISVMPANTDVERRDRAVIAFTLLTGARDSAIASIKLKHVDLVRGSVFQDAREVRTKFSKSFTTYFFPVGEEVLSVFEEWVTHLRANLLWELDDPLFPSTRMALGATSQFEAVGLERKHWSTATAIRKIFRDAFTSAGLPYFNPHSLRSTLAQFGESICQNPEQFKAWSQNLGHEQVLTTFTSYGTVAPQRQSELIRGLGDRSQKAGVDPQALVEALSRLLSEQKAQVPN